MRPQAKNDGQGISVAEFLKRVPPELEIDVIAGESGLTRRCVSSSRIQKLGLALAGFSKYIKSGRVQMAGQSEMSFLSQLDGEGRRAALDNLDIDNICCITLTSGSSPPPELIEAANEHGLPLLKTPAMSSVAIRLITGLLEHELAPTAQVHGVLMEMYGIGVMLIGESGVGKSECALDLISRGHRLVSDDVVQIRRIGSVLNGRAPELTFEFLEIRGLGIINIKELFGVSSICDQLNLELCIELKRWSEYENIERIGLEMGSHELLDISLGKFVLPVSPGRNLSTLVETAVRLYMLRATGANPAADLVKKHSSMLDRRDR